MTDKIWSSIRFGCQLDGFNWFHDHGRPSCGSCKKRCRLKNATEYIKSGVVRYCARVFFVVIVLLKKKIKIFIYVYVSRVNYIAGNTTMANRHNATCYSPDQLSECKKISIKKYYSRALSLIHLLRSSVGKKIIKKNR